MQKMHKVNFNYVNQKKAQIKNKLKTVEDRLREICCSSEKPQKKKKLCPLKIIGTPMIINHF
jgi:hypothetical protein